ncbi:hypothetical protein LIER_17832 [Lithospermum erythrorhizon]|uniref:Uncharacterized protein n=1 Tax=Lithospermum erythrorhizon TaxID=34254 RepID=A0AAV3QBX7_LITER
MVKEHQWELMAPYYRQLRTKRRHGRLRGEPMHEDTIKIIVAAFMTLGQEDKKKMVHKKYQTTRKYIHFKGEHVRVRKDIWDNAL